ncbi:hypothetical protein [Pontibacter sp. G13]|uniref:hypothetical protein n=1 Tax=Pontibacter sp. G13 TaxID=3074898 RepID=UPI00288AC098|nr:hypothetical protein [Pontibacter sp. G13]WNJ19059.1 hypothetical protein RJD25_01090 [Pontibacter sp. G13]
MKNRKVSFILSFIVGLTFTSTGLTLMLLDMADLGMSIFFFLPLAIGISSGLLPNLKQAFLGTLASLAVFSVFVIATKIEGVICLLMAAPILLTAVWIGWWIGKMLRKNKGEPDVKASFAPILIFIVANILELFSGSSAVPDASTTSMVLNGTPEAVYAEIIEVDTVDVETNLLHKIGLPTPRKCVLTAAQVGGLRLCDFEEGRIVETIQELVPNEYLRMEVTEVELGHERTWLTFDEDIYQIEDLGDGTTRISRTTTYSSTLKPRIYWAYMEHLTIESEHDFVFRNLRKDVEGR